MKRLGGMRRLRGIIAMALLSLGALPTAASVAAQTGPGVSELEVGGLYCWVEGRFANETQGQYQQRLRNQEALPDWIWAASSRMTNAANVMTFKFQQIGNDRILYASGEVDDQAATNLEIALNTYGPIHEVRFNSPGGNSAQGVLMGKMIREHGAGTRVLSGDGCGSACSTAFLGGRIRNVEPGALYGIHVYSRPLDTRGARDQNDQNTRVQQEVREATERSFYVTEMGIGKLWLDLWSSTNPGCMTFMSQAEMRKSLVDNER